MNNDYMTPAQEKRFNEIMTRIAKTLCIQALIRQLYARILMKASNVH